MNEDQPQVVLAPVDVGVSNGELYRMIKALHETIALNNETTASSFKEVIIKQDKTNGRVTFLEKMMWLFMGGLAMLALLNVPGRIIDVFSK